MALQVSARLKGDDYQHLIAWWYVLALKRRNSDMKMVRIEDAQAGAVDDVTVWYEPHVAKADEFLQVKYHVDHRGQYTTDALIDPGKQEKSLLKKFWDAWKMLRSSNPDGDQVLRLITNWTFDADDKLGSCISGEDNGFADIFFTSSGRSDIGKLRAKLRAHLGAGDADFEQFCRALRLRFGYDCWDELKSKVIERMDALGLKSEEADLYVAVGIVREWVKAGKQDITLDVLEEVLSRNSLYQPVDAERSATVYLTTIKDQKFEVEPDYILDWRRYFEGMPNRKGHALVSGADWNDDLLPEAYDLADRVAQESDCRLIRARGLARLSAWFAFGHAFPEVAKYIIEVDQRGNLWRTDAPPSIDFAVTPATGTNSPLGETISDGGSTVAVGISIIGSLERDVRKYLEENGVDVSALLLLQPSRPLGNECLQVAGDAVALADAAKYWVREFAKERGATRVLLFYYGPLSGACFIGHKLNAVCREIQVMEDQQPGYSSSFLLK